MHPIILTVPLHLPGILFVRSMILGIVRAVPISCLSIWTCLDRMLPIAANRRLLMLSLRSLVHVHGRCNDIQNYFALFLVSCRQVWSLYLCTCRDRRRDLMTTRAEHRPGVGRYVRHCKLMRGPFSCLYVSKMITIPSCLRLNLYRFVIFLLFGLQGRKCSTEFSILTLISTWGLVGLFPLR